MPDYISKEKKAELEIELKYLQTTKRQEVLAALEYAKSLGDLSENAEYQEARDSQRKLQQRIEEIEQVLKNSTVVEKHSSSVVDIGSTVTIVKTADGSQKKFTLVGAEEADMASGKLSHKSPLGSALMGVKAGETVTFDTPGGKVEYKIIVIE